MPEKIIATVEDDHKNFGKARLNGFLCVCTFMMRLVLPPNSQNLLDFAGVGAGEEQEKTVVAYYKQGVCTLSVVDQAAKKQMLDHSQKLFLGYCTIRKQGKEN